MSAKMKKLFEQVHKVPQVPEVVRILISQFNDPNVNMKDISKNVEKEQVIALKVLRLVNSAYFGLPKKIATIEEAVVMLGMAKLRTLVIASGIVSSIPEIKDFDVKQFWLESFCTAVTAKWLANEAECDGDIAFTAGLISGLGSILIHLGRPKEALDIEKRVAEGHLRPFVENMRLGYTSQAVCAELCTLWKFSEELIIPVAQCGEPLKSAEVSKIACAIFVGKYLSTCRYQGKAPDEIMQSIPFDVTEKLDLSEVFFKEKLEEILALESGLDGLVG